MSLSQRLLSAPSKHTDRSLARPRSADCLCLSPLALHEQITDILISITAADTSDSPVDLFAGSVAFAESRIECWCEIVHSPPQRFVLHSGRFPSETIQLFKESEKAVCFLVFLFTEGCWNTETGRDTTTYRDSALIWVKLCLLLAQSGTFSSLI